MNTVITSGTFVNTASTPYFIPLQQGINSFFLQNQSKMASVTSGRITQATFNNLMTNGTAIVDAITNFATTPAVNGAVIRSQLAQNGFTLYDPSTATNGPNVSIQSFVPGSPTVFTAAAHGFIVGDIVRIGNMKTAAQLGGISMTVTAVTTNTFTTLLNSTNAVTSVGTVYKVGSSLLPTRGLYYPQYRGIASISQANPMVVTTLVQQNYQVGDKVRFQIPTVYGMSQLNTTTTGLPVEFTVVAVNNAIGTQTVSLDVDSSAFTAFAWPAITTTGAYPASLPVMIPQGEWNLNSLQPYGVVPAPLPYANQNILGFATQNQGARGILIGAGDGTAAAGTGGLIGSTADTWTWVAYSSTQTFP